jgi:hypothetical protein
MPEARPAGGVRTPLTISLVVVLLLATVGSFGAAFGTLTDCTTTFGCTETACPPCATASSWLTRGWIAQGVLLLAGVAPAVLAARRLRPAAVRRGALGLASLAAVLFVLTTTMAATSY